MAESAFVEAIANKAQGENGGGERIAGYLRAATEQLSQDFVVILYAVLELSIDQHGRRGWRGGVVEPCLATMLWKKVSIRLTLN